MANTAQGSFDVKVAPLAPYNDKPETKLGRYSIDKTFSGDLEATSKGEMLSAGSGGQGSGAYVAIELVEGRLHDRQGSFILQHTGVMERGKPTLSVTVVPESGTGALAGLSGRMIIDITGGEHHYRFEYEVAASTSEAAANQPSEPTPR